MPAGSRPRNAAEIFLVAGAAALALVFASRSAGPDSTANWLIPAVLLYLPLAAVLATDRDFRAVGLEGGNHQRTGRDLALFLFVILPVFLAGYYLLMHYGLGRSFAWRLPPNLGALAAWHLAGVALPEEVFFRGWLQDRLNRIFGKPWRLLGAEIGPGLFVAAALFALVHLVTGLRPERLLVFFPGLLFGWMRERSASIWGAAAAHGASNFFFQVLQNFEHGWP